MKGVFGSGQAAPAIIRTMKESKDKSTEMKQWEENKVGIGQHIGEKPYPSETEKC
jgi:hypothetical protein